MSSENFHHILIYNYLFLLFMYLDLLISTYVEEKAVICQIILLEIRVLQFSVYHLFIHG